MVRLACVRNSTGLAAFVFVSPLKRQYDSAQQALEPRGTHRRRYGNPRTATHHPKQHTDLVGTLVSKCCDCQFSSSTSQNKDLASLQRGMQGSVELSMAAGSS